MADDSVKYMNMNPPPKGLDMADPQVRADFEAKAVGWLASEFQVAPERVSVRVTCQVAGETRDVQFRAFMDGVEFNRQQYDVVHRLTRTALAPMSRA